MTEYGKSIRAAYRPELVILIVEDHMLFTKDVKHALPEHAVFFARSLEEAKLLYDKHLPDVVFLDIDLPDGNGFEMLDWLHDHEQESYVVMLTGSKVATDVALAQQKGAKGYIIKPFTKSKIEKYIGEYFEFREQQIKQLLAETENRRNDFFLLTPDKSVE